MKLSNRAQGLLFASLSAILFGLTPVLVKDAYSGGLDSLSVTFWSSSIAAILLLILYWLRKGRQKPTRKLWLMAAAVGLIDCGTRLFESAALKYISVGNTTALFFLYPVIVFAINVLVFSARVTPLKLLAACSSTLGVFIMSMEGALSFMGCVMAILSAVSMAVSILMIEHTELDDMDDFDLALGMQVTAAAVLFVGGSSTHTLICKLSAAALFGVVKIAVLSCILAQVFLQIGIQKAGGVTSSMASTLHPLTSVVLGILLFQEAMNAKVVVGCALICLGTIANAAAPAKPAAQQKE